MLLDLLLSAFISPAYAFAEPNIQLDMQVAKEVLVEDNGAMVHRWVVAEDVGPGEKLRYTVFYVNQGDEPATEVRIENPIPELTVYVSDSATGQGSTIMFSADGGEQYDAADSVTYQVRVFGGGTDRRLASAERFTNIRWMIDRVPPGSMGEVSFEVVVE
ncbi:MAG: hypothetical protein NWR61_06155 [Pseudomonadales bacterium]|jgi:uncharacterized repeat protein (TIGR01451 family)|nr:hypothetical protein [Pseudomonadales bacterium]MDP4640829.1 hypothetical protein [Pseudomonadales bacterium]MDP4765915.1 hypothetical protein [Pseudomonadales bacterium]MDP4875449.1 hypothetical protein [Pseudomonadales bacterium]MDP4911403.1 hypothetical protein [Pseudomonadales bacterium]